MKMKYGKFKCRSCEAIAYAEFGKDAKEFEDNVECECGGRFGWISLSTAPFTEMEKGKESGKFLSVGVVFKGEGWTRAPIKLGRKPGKG